MELFNKEITGLTITELICEINEIKKIHDDLKLKTSDLTFEVEKLEQEINDNLLKIKIVEEHYINLIEEYNKR